MDVDVSSVLCKEVKGSMDYLFCGCPFVIKTMEPFHRFNGLCLGVGQFHFGDNG